MALRTNKTTQADKGEPTSGRGLSDSSSYELTPGADPASIGQCNRKAIGLSMALPGARLEMALGGSHPLLLELVRHLARAAASDEHAMQTATMPARQTPRG